MLVLILFQESYNTGDYINNIVNRQKAEIISNVLYPDDRSYQVHIYINLINLVYRFSIKSIK